MNPIEELITRLVQEAPALDAQVITALVDALHHDGSPLAASIAQVVTLVGEQRIAAGIALPALAMACSTLVDARLTDKERDAARYEIDTLLPVPDAASRAPNLAAPDVPLARLSRGPRPRT